MIQLLLESLKDELNSELHPLVKKVWGEEILNQNVAQNKIPALPDGDYPITLRELSTNDILGLILKNIETNDNDPFNLTKLGIKDKINKKIETNSKIIEWSDGSYQLVIGDTYFDILISDAANTNIGLLDIENDIVNVGKSIDKKMILMVSEDFEDRDFLETNKHLERSKVKLANTFFDSTHYVKDENMNKYSKKPSKKEDNESMAGRKRSRP